MLNMFRALLCPSSGAHDYSADYHMGRLVLGLLLVGSYIQGGWIIVRAVGYSYSYNFEPTATQELEGPCGNQHYRCELLRMGIEVSETC